MNWIVIRSVIASCVWVSGYEACLGKVSTENSQATWTVMIYGGVDSSAEDHIMPHLRSLATLSAEGQAGNILLLLDRAPGYSEDEQTLGENFEDTRLFRLEHGKWSRISGGSQFPEISRDSEFEANTGDPETLKKFIKLGKVIAPAKYYALVMFGHGECRCVCPDLSSPCKERDEQDDPLYVAEITGTLNDTHSVDLLWFDVCSFGSIENAYQFRPGKGRFSADAMLASPPLSAPAPMARILEAAGILGESAGESNLPKDGHSFGNVAVEAIRKNLNMFKGFKEAWSCYDLNAVENVKRLVDRLAVALAEGDAKEAAEKVRGNGKNPETLNYMHRRKGSPRMWVVSPHFDLFDLTQGLADSQDVPEKVRSCAQDVANSVDRMVLTSFGGGQYKGFKAGKHGVYIVFPDGDGEWRGKPQWTTFQWYHPDDRSRQRYAFGKYAWCADGATANNDKVENWFELMDSWYDRDDATGGVNNYRK